MALGLPYRGYHMNISGSATASRSFLIVALATGGQVTGYRR